MSTAQTIYNQALEIAEGCNNDILKANCLKGIGSIDHILANYEKAVEYGKKALDIFRTHICRDDEAECLHLIALNAFFLGNYEKGLENASKGIEVSKKIGNRFYEAWCYLDQAFIFADLGNYRKGIDLCRKARRIFGDIGSAWGCARSLIFESWVQSERDEPKELLDTAERGLQLCREVGDKTIEHSFMSRIGQAHTSMCNYNAAFESFNHAHSLIAHPGPVEIDILDRFTRFWLEVANTDNARLYLEEFRQMNQLVGTRTSTMKYMLDAANLKLLENSYDEADEQVTQALGIAKETKHARCFIESTITKAKIALKLGESDIVQKYAKEGLNLAAKYGKHANQVELQLILARLYLDGTNVNTALSHTRMAVGISQEHNIKPLNWQAHHVLAKVYKKQKDERARDELKKAEESLASIVSTLEDNLRRTYLQRTEIKELQADLQHINHNP